MDNTPREEDIQFGDDILSVKFDVYYDGYDDQVEQYIDVLEVNGLDYSVFDESFISSVEEACFAFLANEYESRLEAYADQKYNEMRDGC